MKNQLRGTEINRIKGFFPKEKKSTCLHFEKTIIAKHTVVQAVICKKENEIIEN